jgi:hypothetical protein
MVLTHLKEAPVSSAHSCRRSRGSHLRDARYGILRAKIQRGVRTRRIRRITHAFGKHSTRVHSDVQLCAKGCISI